MYIEIKKNTSLQQNKSTYNWTVADLSLRNVVNATVSWKLCTEIFVNLYIGSWEFVEHCLQIQWEHLAEAWIIMHTVKMYNTWNTAMKKF